MTAREYIGGRAGRWAPGEGRLRDDPEPMVDWPLFPFGSVRDGDLRQVAARAAGHIPQEGVAGRMRRYELMLVLRPDMPDDRLQAVLDRTTRAVSTGGGQILKVAPWGRRRLAYPIERFREGSYHIVLFEAPPEVVAELERGLLITEEVLRHLVTRVERPVRAARRDEASDEGVDISVPEEEEEEEVGERIDESESEAAPAAID